ncbi:beta-xylosidase family glycoside hydrolase [Symmachiella macrocystis]|nr:DUF1349 domain-containing protein [Symmachiella macrocystis]
MDDTEKPAAGPRISIATEYGTLKIETFDPEITLRMEQGGKVVKLTDPQTKKTVQFDAVHGTMRLADQKAQALAAEFQFKRDKKIVARAWIKKSEPRLGFRDDFDKKYDPAWEIFNKAPTHISLTKQPGWLTITTQRGDLWHRHNNTKNIFLLKNPIADGGDFVLTTHIADFEPESDWNQAGLICYDDVDNYLAYTFQYDENQGGRSLCLVREEEAKDLPQAFLEVDRPLDGLWLRIIKRDNQYLVASSLDGQHYHITAVETWGNGEPLKVGLLATNGQSNADMIDASFDFFEITPIGKDQKRLFSDKLPK